jgi:hypothetical protein
LKRSDGNGLENEQRKKTSAVREFAILLQQFKLGPECSEE